jgi:putative SOS response-associated peptidase YedK
MGWWDQFTPKAMPVILITPKDYDVWLNAPTEEVLTLQRSVPDDLLMIVAKSQKPDPLSETRNTLPLGLLGLCSEFRVKTFELGD